MCNVPPSAYKNTKFKQKCRRSNFRMYKEQKKVKATYIYKWMPLSQKISFVKRNNMFTWDSQTVVGLHYSTGHVALSLKIHISTVASLERLQITFPVYFIRNPGCCSYAWSTPLHNSASINYRIKVNVWYEYSQLKYKHLVISIQAILTYQNCSTLYG